MVAHLPRFDAPRLRTYLSAMLNLLFQRRQSLPARLMPLLFVALLGLVGCGPATDSPTNDSSANANPASNSRGEKTQSAASVTTPGAPIVLISIDTLRSDRLPAYGYDGVETPAIDALAVDGLLFERAYAHYPLTLPSHASLLTGRLPPDHGVRDNAGYRLTANDPTYLPTLLQAAGYKTGATVSSYAIRGETGLAQGFDLYDDRTGDENIGGVWGPERFGPATLEVAKEWLGGVANDPFFLFFHIYEPHVPYTPPEPFLERYGRTYEAEIAAADAVVGGLIAELKRLGIYEKALIVLLSDHGEGLMDHEEETHGILLYRELIQVPLIVKMPDGALAGRRVGAPAQLIDVAPTILDTVGLPRPQALVDARLGLLQLLDAESPESELPLENERPIYAETWYPRLHLGWNELTSLVLGRFHYIHGPDPELYDLVEDPAETQNILRDNRRVYTTLRDRLATLEKPLTAPEIEDPETLEQLAALGYLGSSQLAEGPLPDPKAEMARTWKDVRAFEKAFSENRFADVVTRGEALLDNNPAMIDIWRKLGTAFMALERPEDALNAFEKALDLNRADLRVVIQVGEALAALGRLDEARQHADLAAEREPVRTAELRIGIALAARDVDAAVAQLGVRSGRDAVSPATRRRVGLALAEAGRPAQAVELLKTLVAENPIPPSLNALASVYFEAGQIAAAAPLLRQVLEQDPENALAHERLALLALQSGNAAAAEGHLQRSLARDPSSANAWNLLGVLRYQGGNAAGALEAWQKSVELDPRQWDSLYNLGFTAARLGRRQLAAETLRRYVETAPKDLFGREIAEARRLLSQL